jgi:hypothetical protein
MYVCMYVCIYGVCMYEYDVCVFMYVWTVKSNLATFGSIQTAQLMGTITIQTNKCSQIY